MDWVNSLKDWGATHGPLLWWIFALSVALTLLTPLIVGWIIVRLPTNYFVEERHRRLQSLEQYPILRVLVAIAKNLVGVVLLVAGIIMLVAPGQGLLTIVISLTLIDFPGKYRLERWLISRPHVWRSVHWLRKRAGQADLQRPE